MDTPPTIAKIGKQTIQDPQTQRTSSAESADARGSIELFEDLIQPFLRARDFRGARVADIGGGTGRVVRILAQAGCAHITAVEPAGPGEAPRRDVAELAEGVSRVHAAGDRLPPSGDLDFVVSFDVLHHLPDPLPVVRAAYRALRPGGRIVVWLYGKEGNELYLRMVQPLRRITHRLPRPVLSALSSLLMVPLSGYIYLCHSLDLPMREYMLEHMGKIPPEAQRLTIYDQLAPAWARYYTRDEAEGLLRDGGFADVRSYNRHGYSWTVIATKPA